MADDVGELNLGEKKKKKKKKVVLEDTVRPCTDAASGAGIDNGTALGANRHPSLIP